MNEGNLKIPPEGKKNISFNREMLDNLQERVQSTIAEIEKSKMPDSRSEERRVGKEC